MTTQTQARQARTLIGKLRLLSCKGKADKTAKALLLEDCNEIVHAFEYSRSCTVKVQLTLDHAEKLLKGLS